LGEQHLESLLQQQHFIQQWTTNPNTMRGRPNTPQPHVVAAPQHAPNMAALNK
tara:strand:+ start:1768 stop:1926 length:159 start_codon:yes stop_codon:yes gene_type:complete